MTIKKNLSHNSNLNINNAIATAISIIIIKSTSAHQFIKICFALFAFFSVLRISPPRLHRDRPGHPYFFDSWRPLRICSRSARFSPMAAMVMIRHSMVSDFYTVSAQPFNLWGLLLLMIPWDWFRTTDSLQLIPYNAISFLIIISISDQNWPRATDWTTLE